MHVIDCAHNCKQTNIFQANIYVHMWGRNFISTYNICLIYIENVLMRYSIWSGLISRLGLFCRNSRHRDNTLLIQLLLPIMLFSCLAHFHTHTQSSWFRPYKQPQSKKNPSLIKAQKKYLKSYSQRWIVVIKVCSVRSSTETLSYQTPMYSSLDGKLNFCYHYPLTILD